ncbi:MFS transporter [Paenibacillus sp. Soil750]|uniref:MFS transporter n=1 Tax=Paenibacillus sp. Soil750 TaxID=1736398 RepID=UPI000B068CB4|nr:MFS transporter [Paenibacillus sp. Soil750]
MNQTKSKFYYGWIIVLLTFVTLLVSAGIRSMPSVLMIPFQEEFGWSRAAISSVASIGILLYGLVGPFSAALLLRFGIRKVVLLALSVLGASLAVTPLINSLWQFDLLWGSRFRTCKWNDGQRAWYHCQQSMVRQT